MMETFGLTREGRGKGNFEAKENPKMEIMIPGLCEIGRSWFISQPHVRSVLNISLLSDRKGNMIPMTLLVVGKDNY